MTWGRRSCSETVVPQDHLYPREQCGSSARLSSSWLARRLGRRRVWRDREQRGTTSLSQRVPLAGWTGRKLFALALRLALCLRLLLREPWVTLPCLVASVLLVHTISRVTKCQVLFLCVLTRSISTRSTPQYYPSTIANSLVFSRFPVVCLHLLSIELCETGVKPCAYFEVCVLLFFCVTPHQQAISLRTLLRGVKRGGGEDD